MLIENPALSSLKDSLQKALSVPANTAVARGSRDTWPLGEYRNLICCAVILLCIGLVNLFFLSPIMEQNQVTTEKISKLQKEQQELSSFAREYSNFAAFRESRLQEISSKAGTLSKDVSVNDYLSKLSKLSAEHNIRLESVKISGKALPVSWNKRLLYERLDLHLKGDFYNIVRFLRKLERDAVSVADFKAACDEKTGSIRCELTINIYKQI